MRSADRVDYRAIRAMRDRALKLYPDATNVTGRWHAGEPYVEVWHQHQARTVIC